MKSKIKRLWFQSFVCFYTMGYLIPIITEFVEIWARNWSYYSITNTDYISSILFFRPLINILFASITYYYVYKLEYKYVLKIIIILTCILNIQSIYNIHNYSRWFENLGLEPIVRESLLFYIRLFYCITSYRLYKTFPQNLNVLIPVSISSATYILYKLIGKLSIPTILQSLNLIILLLIITFCLLSDSIQLLTFNYINNILQKTIKKLKI